MRVDRYRGEDDPHWRLTRWKILARDGVVFDGLNPEQSAELAELEKEFGPSGLPEDKRS